jgi:hypothetical protein
MTDDNQMNLFEYDLTFVKFLRDSVRKGELAKLTPVGVSVVICLRSCAPISGTYSFPSIPRIMEYCGIGRRAVMNALKILEKEKYISKRRVGRKNVYDLLEKIHLRSTDPDVRDDQLGLLPYGAYETRKHFPDLQKFAKEGVVPRGSPIVIHNIDLTINYAATGSTAFFFNGKEISELPAWLQDTDTVQRVLAQVGNKITSELPEGKRPDGADKDDE